VRGLAVSTKVYTLTVVLLLGALVASFAYFLSAQRPGGEGAKPAEQYKVAFYVRDTKGNPVSGATLAFNGTNYSDEQSATVPAGTYWLSTGSVPSDYSFSQWEAAGNVTVTSSDLPSVMATVNGNGAIVMRLIYIGALSQLNFEVISIDIVKTSSVTLISATIKNSGTKPITACTVTVYDDDGNSVALNLGSVDVGQSKSVSQTYASGLSFTVGKSYPVKIDATASDGSTLSKSLTVTCTG